MKKFLILAVALSALFSPNLVYAKGSHKHYSYQGGHYAGGHGSSHKGGHYVNPRTANHYTHHNR